MTKMKFVGVEVTFRHATDKAALVVKNDEEVWIPRSNLNLRSDDVVDRLCPGEEVTLQIVDWFVQQEGL